MATDGIHTPFAGGAPGDARPPRVGSMRQMSREPSGNGTGVFLGGHFDEVLPSAPSLDEVLLQITQGVGPERSATAAGALPSMPSRIFTMSAGKSLSAMASLDLSWLGDGAAAAQQAAAAAAGTGAGAQGSPDSTPPDASPMPPYLPSRTVAPDTVRVHYPGTPTPTQTMVPPPVPPPPAPPALPGAIAPPAAGMEAVHAALMEAQAAYWRALEAHSAGQGLQQPHGLPGAPTPYSGPTPQADPNQQWALQQASIVSMMHQGQQGPLTPPPASPTPPVAAPFVPFTQPQSCSAAGPFPVYVPTDIGPPRTPHDAQADAMAQWARERALMASMTGSDLESATRSMAEVMGSPEGWNGGGGLGAAAPGGGRIGASGGSGTPTVHLTCAQPIKLACAAPSYPQPRPVQ